MIFFILKAAIGIKADGIVLTYVMFTFHWAWHIVTKC